MTVYYVCILRVERKTRPSFDAARADSQPLNIHASLVVETDGNVNASDAIRGRGGGKKEKKEM